MNMIDPITALLVGGLFYGADKSLKLDAKALKKRRQAANLEFEGQEMVRKRREFCEKRLQNVVKKKQSIVKVTLQKFIDIYSTIEKILVERKELPKILTIPENLTMFEKLPMVVQQPLSDTECLVGLISPITMSYYMIKDSERELSAARSQLRAANLSYEQSKSKNSFFDAVIERADKLAVVLSGFNFLVINLVEKSSLLIEKNGSDKDNYSQQEIEVLKTLVNAVCGMIDVVNVPVFEKEGKISEAAFEMLDKGERNLQELQKLINKGY